MILLSMTYETWDEDALEAGETNDTGYVWEDIRYSFKELVHLIKSTGLVVSSCYPPDAHGWVSTHEEQDYRTGEYTTYSLFFSHKNKEADRKYWEKALRYCNIIKGV